jgi:hypothetical protein
MKITVPNHQEMVDQVAVRHRTVTSVILIYVNMYILVKKINMATAPHVMWYWTPMKIGKNTVTMIQITVPNHQEMVDQVAVRHRTVTSVILIYVNMYILVKKINMATAPHVMWYWTPMKIGKNTVTMIQITVLNRQMVMTAMKNMANTPSETALLLLKDVDHIGLAMKNSLFGMTPMLTAIIYLIK